VGVNTLYKGAGAFVDPTAVSPAMNCDGTLTGTNVPCYMPTDTRIGDGTLGLRADHPVNFTYDATLAAKSLSLVVTITNPSGLGGARTGVTTSSGKFLPLFANKLQCPTCHAVHSNANGRPFLRASTAGSELCLGCHGK
jgi:predicted CXXCH cytochrome family protein